MHPVLIYALVWVVTALVLLSPFEKYVLGSFQLFLFVTILLTAVFGKILTYLFPYTDPMQIDARIEENSKLTRDYRREIQYLFNVVQPDPKLQPVIKRLPGSLMDYFELSDRVIYQRLRQHFGEDFDLVIDAPIVTLVRDIQQRYPGWPNHM